MIKIVTSKKRRECVNENSRIKARTSHKHKSKCEEIEEREKFPSFFQLTYIAFSITFPTFPGDYVSKCVCIYVYLALGLCTTYNLYVRTIYFVAVENEDEVVNRQVKYT